MEKRCFRMGVNKKRFYCFNNLGSSDFLSIQNLWGYEKNRLNNVLNSYILGFKNGFGVFKSDFSIEYLIRCSIYCFNLVSNKITILFLIPSVSHTIYDNNLKELIVFFSLRSLQPFIFVNKIDCFLKKIALEKSCILLTCVNRYDFFVKDSLSNLIPFIYVEDVFSKLNKGPYYTVGNNNCIDYAFFWYTFISNSILKSMLLSYCKHLKPF